MPAARQVSPSKVHNNPTAAPHSLCAFGLPYAFQRLGHAFPVLRPARLRAVHKDPVRAGEGAAGFDQRAVTVLLRGHPVIGNFGIAAESRRIGRVWVPRRSGLAVLVQRPRLLNRRSACRDHGIYEPQRATARQRCADHGQHALSEERVEQYLVEICRHDRVRMTRRRREVAQKNPLPTDNETFIFCPLN